MLYGSSSGEKGGGRPAEPRSCAKAAGPVAVRYANHRAGSPRPVPQWRIVARTTAPVYTLRRPQVRFRAAAGQRVRDTISVYSERR